MNPPEGIGHNIPGFLGKHMMAVFIIAGGFIAVLLYLRSRSSGSASTVQYPDQYSTGVPATPIGSQAGTSLDQSGTSGVGGTVTPSDLFSSFLTGYQFGQQQTASTPTDSAGQSTPINQESTTVPAISSGLTSVAAIAPSAPSTKQTGVPSTAKTPIQHQLISPRKATTVQTQVHPAIDTQSARKPLIAGTGKAASHKTTGHDTVNTPKITQPSHAAIHLPGFPAAVFKQTGTHIGTAVHVPTQTPPPHVGPSITRPTKPPGNKLPQIDPVHATSTPRQTPVPISATLPIGATVGLSEKLSAVASRASDILKPVVPQANKVPAAQPSKARVPSPAIKASGVAKTSAMKPQPAPKKSAPPVARIGGPRKV